MFWSSKLKSSSGDRADAASHRVAGEQNSDPSQCGPAYDRQLHHPVANTQSVSPDFAEPAGQPCAPHCGKPQGTDDEPHRGKPNLERALNALLLTWARVARPAPGSTAKELAIALCRALQAQPELIGVRVYEQWINGTICSSARPSAWKGRRPTRAFFTNSKGKCPTNVMTCSSWASRGRPSRPIECLIRTRPWLPLSDEMGKRA